jgi:hypothetical protein
MGGKVADAVVGEPVMEWTSIGPERLFVVDRAEEMARLDGVGFGGLEQLIELIRVLLLLFGLSVLA